MNSVEEVKPTIVLTREQLADITYSAAVQGLESVFDHHRKMPTGAALNQIAEGIADSAFSNPSYWQRPGLRGAKKDELA